MKLDLNEINPDNQSENLQSVSDVTNAIQVPLRQLAETAQTLTQAIVATFQSEAVQNALRISQELVKAIASIDYRPILKKFSEAMLPIKYIYLLERIKWPLFLLNDDELRDKILSACAVNEDVDAVRDIVFEYCNEDYFDALEKDWSGCSAIKQERKPILSEAIQMHKMGFYYSSVSALMCQVYGIASDIVQIVKKNKLELDDESKDYVADQLGIRREDIDKEKGRLLQSVMITESGRLLWEAMAGYLQNEILCSSDSKQRWNTQPLRNKICHGDQLNFGTKEHSIKAILTIDMLIQLAYEINRIAELQKASELEKGMDDNGQQMGGI